MYAEGRGVPQDNAEAVKWYRRAAEWNADAQYNLGLMYAEGRGVPLDDAEAVKWYRRAADQGNADAQSSCESLERRMADRAEAQAAEAEVKAETGLASRSEGFWTTLGKQIVHSLMPATTRMPEKNASRHGDEDGLSSTQASLDPVRRAADQGDAVAQHNLGLMYEEGRGVPQDDAEAVKWYRRAADQGNALAQDKLGVIYVQGRGVPQDDAEAVKWFQRAANQGDAIAQHNLGLMYEEGRSVPQDDAEAAKWFRRAADQGYAVAQFNLGNMYFGGRGVPHDTKADSQSAEAGTRVETGTQSYRPQSGRGQRRHPRDQGEPRRMTYFWAARS
jgi:TPR repeat protein